MKDISLLVLRLAFGGLMIVNHAWGKMEKLGDSPIKFPDPLGVGSEFSLYLTVFSEGLCSLLIVLGLFTRIASIPLLITMVVAAFIVHGADPLSSKEMSLLYLGAYTVLLGHGAGKFSLDNLLRPRARF